MSADVTVQFQRGQIVTARAYGGGLITRRVWRDAARGVLLCSESGYQRALVDGTEPLWSGFPREDVAVAEAADRE